jgi:hypothetical protein
MCVIVSDMVYVVLSHPGNLALFCLFFSLPFLAVFFFSRTILAMNDSPLPFSRRGRQSNFVISFPNTSAEFTRI